MTIPEFALNCIEVLHTNQNDQGVLDLSHTQFANTVLRGTDDFVTQAHLDVVEKILPTFREAKQAHKYLFRIEEHNAVKGGRLSIAPLTMSLALNMANGDKDLEAYPCDGTGQSKGWYHEAVASWLVMNRNNMRALLDAATSAGGLKHAPHLGVHIRTE